MSEQQSEELGNVDEAVARDVFNTALKTFANRELPVDDRLSGAAIVIDFMAGAIAELREMISGLAGSTMASLVLSARTTEDRSEIAKLVIDYADKVERNRIVNPTEWVYDTIAARLEKNPSQDL